MPLQIRRGTNAELNLLAYPLAEGELVLVFDKDGGGNIIPGTCKLRIGDGVTEGGVQVTGFTSIEAKDSAAAIFTDGTHSGISYSYNDVDKEITSTVNLASYAGNISFAEILSNAVPGTDNNFNLGSTLKKWNNLFLGGTLQLGGATITYSGSHVNLPEGSTIGGQTIQQYLESINGNLRVNIIGTDSSVIVNAETGQIRGRFDGDLTGSVYSDDSTIIVDGTDGSIRSTQFYSATGQINVGTGINKVNLYVTSDETAGAGLTLRSTLTGAPGVAQQTATIRYNVSNGTITSPTVVTTGDSLGSFQFGGRINGGALGVIDADLAAIKAVISDQGDLSSNYAKAKIQFFVANSDSPVDAVTAEFSNKGVFSAPILKTGTYADATARDAAIPTPEVGMIIFLTSTGKFQGNTNGTTGGWADLN